jgi:periplasmic protein TonB
MLPVEPTIVVPPQIKLPQSNTIGDLKSVLTIPSNGVGLGSGIGNSDGGGIGSGKGPGLGPGQGGGIGGGLYRVGGGVSPPRIIYQIDPEFSEEARKAKYQGTVIVNVEIYPDGRVHNARIARSLGLGLDEKALEAVRQWKFEPARKDGQPVAVLVNVEVNFRLY